MSKGFFGGRNDIFGEDDMDYMDDMDDMDRKWPGHCRMGENPLEDLMGGLGKGMPGMDGMMDDLLKSKMDDLIVKLKGVLIDSPLMPIKMFRLQHKVAGMKAEHSAADKTLESFHGMLTDLKEKYAAVKKELEENQKKLAEAKNKVDHLEATVNHQENFITRQGQQVIKLEERSNELITNLRNQADSHQSALSVKDEEYSDLMSVSAGAQLTISDIKQLIQGMSGKPQAKDYKVIIEAVMQAIHAHEDAIASTPVKNDDTVDESAVDLECRLV